MKIGPIEITRRQSAVATAHPLLPAPGPVLKDAELALAFAVADSTPWWRAVLQVIDTARAAAHAGAEEMSGSNNQVCAYSAAGAAHLSMVRKTLTDLRESAIKGRNLTTQDAGALGIRAGSP